MTDAEGRREVLAKVLAEHPMVTGFDEVGDYFKYACACSWHGDSDAAHRAHVAAAQEKALGADERDEAFGAGHRLPNGKWVLDVDLDFGGYQ